LEIVEVDEEEEENGDKDGRRDFEVAEEQQRLLVSKVREELEKAVEESLGIPMLFTLLNTFQVLQIIKISNVMGLIGNCAHNYRSP
jgi:hypothetical protein